MCCIQFELCGVGGEALDCEGGGDGSRYFVDRQLITCQGKGRQVLIVSIWPADGRGRNVHSQT